MWNTFKYTALALVRERSLLTWSLLFPFIMATLFFTMFSNLDESFEFKAIPTAVVENADYEQSEAFKTMLEALNEEGDDRMLDVCFVASAEEAKELLREREVVGYYQIDSKNSPSLFVASASELDGLGTMNQTILKDILDTYVRSSATVETLAEKNPLALVNPATVEALSLQQSYTEEISVTENKTSGSIRYFYALLGFATLMAAQVAATALTRTQANLSSLGARRAVGATSRAKTLLATLLASWTLSYLCLLLTFCYMRFALGINFGGQDLLFLFALAVASLMTTALGAFIGALPKVGEGAKSGILTGLTCLLALFAGLYGNSSMVLADEVARNIPVLATINPSKQVADLFYSLYYYDILDPFFSSIVILLTMATAFFLAATIFMRRQRYASL